MQSIELQNCHQMKVTIIAHADQKRMHIALWPAHSFDLQWVSDHTILSNNTEVLIDLAFEPTPNRLLALKQSQASLILLNAVTPTLKSMELDERFTRFNGWPTFIESPVAEVVAPATATTTLQTFFKYWGRQYLLLPDVTGMPSARIVAMIINEAYFALGEGVSTPEEIDTAMKLGTNYPYGPFEWAHKIGLKEIYVLLETLSRNNKRYDIAPWLCKAASHLLPAH